MTCDVHRPRSVKDALNAEKLRWPDDIPVHLSDVRCRLVIKDQRVADTAFAERPIVTTYLLLLPAGTDVRQRDRIANITDAAGTVDAGPFRVEKVRKRRARAVRHISLELERLGI